MITRGELKVGGHYIFGGETVEVKDVEGVVSVDFAYRRTPPSTLMWVSLDYFCTNADMLIKEYQVPISDTVFVNSSLETAIKHDADKPRLDLIPPEALMAVGEVFAYGAEKYEEWNWRKGMAHSRLVSALLRHLMAHQMGEDKDPETGFTHLAHMACNALMLLGSYLNEDGIDDRWKKEK